MTDSYWQWLTGNKERGQNPQSRKKSIPLTFFRSIFGNQPSVKGGGIPPLSVNFFSINFLGQKQCFLGENQQKNTAYDEKMLDFGSIKGGGVPPFPFSFFR
jgi:hypothetical protein